MYSALPVARLLIKALLPGLLTVAVQSAMAQPVDETIPTIVVIGNASHQARIGGAATVINAEAIQHARAFNINEVLRKAPGVFPREEEGFGLRPNIGIRGLNPTRSSKVLLLEDGLPIASSPYGDNASYYHPAIERFSGLEVLKGSAQIGFGPHTVGGVINYLTPNPSAKPTAKLRAAAGTAGYSQLYGEVGNTFGNDGTETGVLLQYVDKQSDGARANMEFAVRDFNVKLVQQLGQRQAATLKFSRYAEDSAVPYSGLTLAEYNANPRANPFLNDTFVAERTGMSLVHHWDITDNIRLDSALYRSEFERDWWRQSSNSGQRPSDTTDPGCGSMANLLTSCGNEGRLRDYEVRGFEPRLQVSNSLGNFKAGLRWQQEDQRRRQINADTPAGRTPGISVNAGLVENNLRDTAAFAWFIEQSFSFGAFTLVPGLRREHIDYSRRNLLNNAAGATNVSKTLAGLGATWQLHNSTVLFAGLHEGFSPPRVEDVISNTNGASVELAAESSLNSELGVRYDDGARLKLEAAWFHMDFDNQIVSSSVAGGAGATLTSAGETLHSGVELLFNWNYDRDFERSTITPFVDLSWTWVRDAEYRGVRSSAINAGVNVSGNRLPYTPEHTLSLTTGIALRQGLRAQVELFQVGEMLTDDLNSAAITANGQRGLIDAYRIYNLSLNYTVPDTNLTLFVAGKNLSDKVYVVDMSRGMIPGMQRTWQGGVEWSF